MEELFALQNYPDKYGNKLAERVFESAAIRERFSESKAVFETRGMPIRLRIHIRPELSLFHGIAWELLRDPKTGDTLATSERIVFSRFIHSTDWRPIKPRRKAELKALIAVASPTNLEEHNLAAVDVSGEIARAREALAGIEAQVLGDKEPLTLNRLVTAICEGADILYLVCHGKISRKLIPYLLLQTEGGTIEKVEADACAQRIRELPEVPRLVVLASCEGAGKEFGDRGQSAQIALAPRLAEAGVPAVVAMQGKISMETVKRAMPTFFSELVRDGQIDRAMSVARGEVRNRVDAWVPALFLRLKDGQLWAEPGDTNRRIFHLPFPRNRFFTARDELLEGMHKSFRGGETVQALNGLGGIGKTQAAAEYAYRYQDFYRTVLWAQAQTRESLVKDFAAMAAAELLGLPEKNAQDQSETVNAVKRWFAQNKEWLLILDNADDLEMAREFIPANQNGRVLLTTRAQNVGDLAARNAVKKMAPAEGAIFLLRKTSKLTKEKLLESAPSELRRQAETLSKELDGLPLALDQAAAFMVEMPSSLEQYLSLYATERAELLAHRGELTQDHPSVTVTFSLAFKQVEQASAAAADLLRVCAFLESDAIPLEVFSDGGKELGESLSAIAESPLKLSKTIAAAHKFSLLEADAETNTVSLHRLVQEVLITELEEPTRKLWQERAVRAVNAAFPSDVEFSNWETCNRLTPHAQKLEITIEKEGFGFEQASRLLNQTASYLYQRARYKEAELLVRRALAIDERRLGSGHPEVGIRLNNLAQLLKATNQLVEAEPLMQRVVTIVEENYEGNHPRVAAALSNLAALLAETNRLVEAEPLMRRALAIDEMSFGLNHPNVGRNLNNLAVLLKATNRLAEAESLMRRALEIAERSFGPEHPDVARNLNNLAQLLQDTNRLVQAESLMQRVVTIVEKSYGGNHPFVAVALSNLAALLADTNRLAEAEPLMRSALAIDEMSFGPDHPNVGINLNNLAQLLWDTNRLAEAEPLMRRAVLIFAASLGADHPKTVGVMGNYWLLLQGLYPDDHEDALAARIASLLQLRS
ncbi:MAG: tetratricopeptide repeat protein [Acidobacteria bacterium]|nr:tetratricopeptide repeat protein [Acidobacteriota bacterium]